MGSSKYIYLFFACAGLLAAYLLSLTIEWVWGYFGHPSDLICNGLGLGVGVIGALICLKSPTLFGGVAAVFEELEKVTWPSRKETSSATVVVMVTVAVAAVILSVFDSLWSFLTGRILG